MVNSPEMHKRPPTKIGGLLNGRNVHYNKLSKPYKMKGSARASEYAPYMQSEAINGGLTFYSVFYQTGSLCFLSLAQSEA